MLSYPAFHGPASLEAGPLRYWGESWRPFIGDSAGMRRSFSHEEIVCDGDAKRCQPKNPILDRRPRDRSNHL